MRNYFLLIVLAALPMFGWAQQYPLVTIEDIQRPNQDSLADCNERSPLLDDTVRVRGVVVVDGGLAYSADGRNIWIQEGPGPWQGIDVRYGGGSATSPVDIWDLVAGDSVEITGVVERFGAETQVNPLENGVTLLDAGRPVQSANIPVGDLNDGNLINQLETGERWEGQYVEITNVTVVTRSGTFGGNRRNFTVEDEDGNQVQISDRFPAARSVDATDTDNRNDDPGELFIPFPGTTFDTIRGLVFHIYPSGCASQGNLTFGYEIHPFKGSDLDIGRSGPQIFGLSRSPVTPNETQSTTIQANIVDPDGNVQNALLYYAVGLSSTNFIATPMTDIGGIYQAEIPASAYNNDDVVKYYIEATDDSAITVSAPSQGPDEPEFFAVRADGTTIYDVQFTPEGYGGFSSFEGQGTTVRGVVTATSQPGDLGYVYIQQPGETEWAGLPLIQNSDLNNLQRGDLVEVTGTVTESFGMTAMEVSAISIENISQPLPDPVVVNPDSFTTRTYYNERFEGMLVTLENPNGNAIYVVDDNADNNTGDSNNFAEYRVGTSVLTDATGCRVIAGRQTGSAFSSLNVSYINDSTFAFNNGVIDPDLPLCIVEPGDSVSSITGIMYYSFGNMKLLPRNNDDYDNYSGENCPNGIGVSISETAPASLLRAYPNPAYDRLIVEHIMGTPQPLQVELLDLMGRSLLTRSAEAGATETELDLSAVGAGLYLLRVSAGQELLFSQKLIVE